MINRTAKLTLSSFDWPLVVMGSLGLWLSGSLVVDLLVLPSLSATGMMTEPGFLNAGHLLFSVFNRLEMVLAALVLSGCWLLHQQQFFGAKVQRLALPLAFSLLAIALIYTYGLTPAITSLGFEMASPTSTGAMPTGMMPLHWLYWGLELVKLGLGLTLLRWFHRPAVH